MAADIKTAFKEAFQQAEVRDTSAAEASALIQDAVMLVLRQAGFSATFQPLSEQSFSMVLPDNSQFRITVVRTW